jgi:hypothetical protein
MADFKLDIFQVLGKLDAGKYDTYDKLSEEEQKEFAPLIVQRWMSSGSERQVIYLNSITNKLIFSLPKHKELIAKLLVVCSDKQRKRYSWIKMPSRKRTEKLAIEVVCKYYGYSRKEAEIQFPLLSPDDIIEHAEELGYQDAELKSLKKELKTK